MWMITYAFETSINVIGHTVFMTHTDRTVTELSPYEFDRDKRTPDTPIYSKSYKGIVHSYKMSDEEIADHVERLSWAMTI